MVHGLSCSTACGIFSNQRLNHCSCIGSWILYHWATKAAPSFFKKDDFLVYLALLGLSCSTWDLHCTLRSFVECGLSACGHGLSCFTVCGILLPWPGIEPTSAVWQVRFLTTGPLGKSQWWSFNKEFLEFSKKTIHMDKEGQICGYRRQVLGEGNWMKVVKGVYFQIKDKY